MNTPGQTPSDIKPFISDGIVRAFLIHTLNLGHYPHELMYASVKIVDLNRPL